MFLIFPVTYEFETSLTPKRLARKLDGELTEYQPTINVFSVSKFMKKHRNDSLYYGRREENSFQLFYHKAKRRDGGETGFYAKFKETENGTKIRGKFRKPVYTYVFGVIWTLITLLFAFVALSVGEKTGAAVCLGLCLIGDGIMFWDDHKPFLRAYLDTLPKAEEKIK